LKKNRIILIASFLIGIIGAANLVVGVWSFLTINSMNLPYRISEVNSALESFDPSNVNTLELQEPLSNLKNSVTEGLNVIFDQSHILNLIPVFLVGIGILFIAIAIAIYFLVSKKETISQ